MMVDQDRSRIAMTKAGTVDRVSSTFGEQSLLGRIYGNTLSSSVTTYEVVSSCR